MKKELMYTHFPYCIQHLDKDRYIILNRDYKPLGTEAFSDYVSHSSVIRINMTKKRAVKLSHNHSDNIERVYLFENTPGTLSDRKKFSEYMARLAELAKMKTK